MVGCGRSWIDLSHSIAQFQAGIPVRDVLLPLHAKELYLSYETRAIADEKQNVVARRPLVAGRNKICRPLVHERLLMHTVEASRMLNNG